MKQIFVFKKTPSYDYKTKYLHDFKATIWLLDWFK